MALEFATSLLLLQTHQMHPLPSSGLQTQVQEPTFHMLCRRLLPVTHHRPRPKQTARPRRRIPLPPRARRLPQAPPPLRLFLPPSLPRLLPCRLQPGYGLHSPGLARRHPGPAREDEVLG
ncbi:hypothetical protein Tsubulata_007371 [Turnera subulata]|uniref:Uncharacterized protein n=1 Tax=Turnera subulata TaxID=218843 RepID=A0A9Q0F9M1_9ROSI|nr:hypothetical protein Tsubulata_007371 [Turnera subulata]